MRTAECLHGGVCASAEEVHGMGLPNLEMNRVLAYPLRRVETLLERCERGAEGRRRVESLLAAEWEDRLSRDGAP